MSFLNIAKKKRNYHKDDINLALKSAAICFESNPVSKSRKRENIYARQAVSIYLREIGFSFMDIGEVLGFDHSNIVHLCNKHVDDMKYTVGYRMCYMEFALLIRKEKRKKEEMVNCCQVPFDFSNIRVKL